MSQNVMITGAGKAVGLGFNMVLRYLEAGDNVVATVRKPCAELEELKTKYGDKLIMLTMDIGSTESVQAAAEELSKTLSHLDLLINKNDFIIENGILKKYIGNSNIVVIPDEVISIGESAFYECKIITSVTIPDTVTSIEWAAFAYCSNLVNIEIPDSVTRIEGVAFDGCINLKNVKLPKNITIINERTFSNCENLNNIIIPNSVTSIEYDAFWGCNKLTSILIPDSVNSIKDGVFETCTNLINITIPDTIINIEGNPFENTPWLAEKRKENPLVIVNGFLIDGKTAEGNIIIPEEVNHICSFCFHKCEKLISVIIPEGVTDIGSYSFSGCTKLRKIEIPKSVSSISYKSFLNCKELINIKIPDSVTNIDSHSFDNTPWLAKKTKRKPSGYCKWLSD